MQSRADPGHDPAPAADVFSAGAAKAALTYGVTRERFEPPPRTLRRFANPDVVCQGWYHAGRARAIKNGGVRRVFIGRRAVVIYRDLHGSLHALDRSCRHLGADLSLGTVVEKGLRCAFHRWCWGADGSCVSGGAARGARIPVYQVRERWGLVWVWAGNSPTHDLPKPASANARHVLRLPVQRLRCHPHVVLGNGLDLTHVVPVHGFHFEDEPIVEPRPPDRLSLHVRARFHATAMRRLLGLAGRTARWSFTTIGPSLAWVTVTFPTPFELLWAVRPLPEGGCATRTLFFLPQYRSLLRALPMMIATTWADRRVLNGLNLQSGFVASDSVFALYARLVEEMPAW
jgi:phenylpropionate dioxygenase-like ring-hydroxylating dioxygenase large terminal subunit